VSHRFGSSCTYEQVRIKLRKHGRRVGNTQQLAPSFLWKLELYWPLAEAGFWIPSYCWCLCMSFTCTLTNSQELKMSSQTGCLWLLPLELALRMSLPQSSSHGANGLEPGPSHLPGLSDLPNSWYTSYSQKCMGRGKSRRPALVK
jgi:hypothetical protein